MILVSVQYIYSMYGSLKSNGSCQQALLDPDHACTEDCQDLVKISVSKKSPKSSFRGSGNSSPSDKQRLLPFSDMSGSVHSKYSELEESGRSLDSVDSRDSRSPLGINAEYHSFEGDPTFSIVSKDHTAEAIKQCEKFVLRPYKFCLRLIGWLPFGHSTAAKVAQGILVSIWTVAILTSMITQILVCFRRDVFISIRAPSINPVNSTDGNHPTIECSTHIISSLILPDIVLLLAYFTGVYLFSRGETEYLFRLACHVFIKNSSSGHVSYNKRLYRSIQFFFLAGVVWLFFSLGIRIMSAYAGDLFHYELAVQWSPEVRVGDSARLVLVFFSLLGFFSFDLVYIFSVLNYAAQAEMNVYLLWDIATLIRTKKYEHIDDMIKDIHESKRYLKVLSRRTATLTGLALFDLFTLAVQSLNDLERVNRTGYPIPHMDLKTLAAVAAGFNCVSWLVLVIAPFIQAARVTHAGELLKDVGPEVRARPYVYEMTPTLDLDSILSYLQTVKLQASLFGVPIFPWMAYAVLVLFTFVLSLLFQLHEFDRLSTII